MLKRMTVLVGFTLVSLAGLAQAATGDKWRVTSSMQAMGMSMPGRTSEVCRQPGSDSPPVSDDKNCQMTNLSRSGNTQTIHMHCTGPHPADGDMTITYLGPDHYKGNMQVNADGQQMTMNYEGQKIGPCDGQEANLQAAQMASQINAQSNAMMVAQCSQFAKDASAPSAMANCHDPNDIKTYCTNFQTYKIFGQQARQQQEMKQSGVNYGVAPPLDQSAQICGVNIEDVRAKLCTGAEGSAQWEFLAQQCPSQADALAKAQCTGRSYSSISDSYRSFCSSYVAASGAGNNSTTANRNTNTAPSLTNAVTDAAKDKLKSLTGLFGH
jgi:hypothetical protein